MKRRRTMPDNVLIPLPGFQLPNDFPWRVGLVAMVDEQLRRLRVPIFASEPRTLADIASSIRRFGSGSFDSTSSS